MPRPLLFVDVDGVLNPYDGPCPPGYSEHALFPGEEPVRLCREHGAWLRELGDRLELVWATSWALEDRALLPPLLDLPPIARAIALPPPPFDPDAKVPAVAAVAGARPLAWLDDELSDTAHRWADGRAAPTLLVPVDPATGLRREHVDALLAWAATA